MFNDISKRNDIKIYTLSIICVNMLVDRKNMITFSILGFTLISAAIIVVFS